MTTISKINVPSGPNEWYSLFLSPIEVQPMMAIINLSSFSIQVRIADNPPGGQGIEIGAGEMIVRRGASAEVAKDADRAIDVVLAISEDPIQVIG